MLCKVVEKTTLLVRYEWNRSPANGNTVKLLVTALDGRKFLLISQKRNRFGTQIHLQFVRWNLRNSP